MRRAAMSALAPLLGDKRTRLGHCETDAVDPDRSSALVGQCTAAAPWTYRPLRWQADDAVITKGGTSHVRHGTAGVCHAARRGGCVATRGTRAAAGDAGDRVPRHWVAGGRCLPVTLVLPGPERNRLRRRTERGD